MTPPPHRVALAVGEPFEARLLALLEDPAFQVAGRGCAVSAFCATVREVREALSRTDTVDAVVMSSTLQAVPPATLSELIQINRPLVLLVPDPTAAHWAELPVPIVGLDTDGTALAAAIGDALLGRRPARGRSRTTASKPGHARATGMPPDQASPRSPQSEVITVSSAEASVGCTSAAVSLAYALSYTAPTVLLDVNSRGSGVEFHLPVDPARGLPQLGRRMQSTGDDGRAPLETEAGWRAALESELQPLGPTGHGWVGCGISEPNLRQYVTADLLQRALATLRLSRRFIVLDGSGSGWAPADPALDRAALQQADRLLVVLRPDEQGVERTRRVLREWPHRERIGLVLNQVGLPGTDELIGAVEFELGASVVASLPFDAYHLAAARARHRPVLLEPGCRLSAPLLDLARRISGGGPIRLPATPRRTTVVPWWRRLAVGATGLFR